MDEEKEQNFKHNWYNLTWLSYKANVTAEKLIKFYPIWKKKIIKNGSFLSHLPPFEVYVLVTTFQIFSPSNFSIRSSSI